MHLISNMSTWFTQRNKNMTWHWQWGSSLKCLACVCAKAAGGWRNHNRWDCRENRLWEYQLITSPQSAHGPGAIASKKKKKKNVYLSKSAGMVWVDQISLFPLKAPYVAALELYNLYLVQLQTQWCNAGIYGKEGHTALLWPKVFLQSRTLERVFM